MTSPKAQLLCDSNLIKDNLSEDLLTSEQRRIYKEIKNSVCAGEKRINLVGPPGVGKTVTCWVLAAQGDWQYLSDMDMDPDHRSVIYDHGSPKRKATRRIRAKMDLHNISRVIYVTREPAEELYPRVSLDPGPDHANKIEESLDGL